MRDEVVVERIISLFPAVDTPLSYGENDETSIGGPPCPVGSEEQAYDPNVRASAIPLLLAPRDQCKTMHPLYGSVPPH